MVSTDPVGDPQILGNDGLRSRYVKICQEDLIGMLLPNNGGGLACIHRVYRHLFHFYFDVYKYLHMHMSFILAGALSRQTLKDSLEFRNLKSIQPVLH